MILSDGTIKTMINYLVDVSKSENTTSADVWNQVNPNSIDLTIGAVYKRPVKSDRPWIYGFRNEAEAEKYSNECWMTRVAKSGFILLEPGAVILGVTREYVQMPDNVCGQIFTKSTLGRMFINHMMAGVVDAGFHGRLTLELKNEGQHSVKIPVGSRVCQMVLTSLDKTAEFPYHAKVNRYNGAETVECAKAENK